jgi:hypothetical protein
VTGARVEGSRTANARKMNVTVRQSEITKNNTGWFKIQLIINLKCRFLERFSVLLKTLLSDQILII